MIRALTNARHFAARPLALRLRDMIALSRQRRALARLDSHLLDDIGLSPRDAAAEARRLPWSVSGHRLR